MTATPREMRERPVDFQRSELPDWLADVPAYLLDWQRDRRGWERLVQYLADQGYPPPTLLQLAAARRFKKGLA